VDEIRYDWQIDQVLRVETGPVFLSRNRKLRSNRCGDSQLLVASWGNLMTAIHECPEIQFTVSGFSTCSEIRVCGKHKLACPDRAPRMASRPRQGPDRRVPRRSRHSTPGCVRREAPTPLRRKRHHASTQNVPVPGKLSMPTGRASGTRFSRRRLATMPLYVDDRNIPNKQSPSP